MFNLLHEVGAAGDFFRIHIPSPVLRLVATVTIPETDGTEIFAGAEYLFAGGVDADFVRWGTNQPTQPTDKAVADVFEVCRNANFAKVFDALPSEKYLPEMTQSQAIAFCRKYPELLHPKGWSTFFPFRVEASVYVANVYSHSTLPRVHIHHRKFAHVCRAMLRPRVVVLRRPPRT